MIVHILYTYVYVFIIMKINYVELESSSQTNNQCIGESLDVV